MFRTFEFPNRNDLLHCKAFLYVVTYYGAVRFGAVGPRTAPHRRSIVHNNTYDAEPCDSNHLIRTEPRHSTVTEIRFF